MAQHIPSIQAIGAMVGKMRENGEIIDKEAIMEAYDLNEERWQMVLDYSYAD